MADERAVEKKPSKLNVAQKFLRSIALERFDRLVFRQPECVVRLREAPAAILRSLPEFTAIVSSEQGLILLRFMTEYRPSSAQDFLRTKRHGEIDLVHLPLGPRSAIKPQLGFGKPRFP